LKPSYFQQALRNMAAIDKGGAEIVEADLFDGSMA